jgi:hypothetical protein
MWVVDHMVDVRTSLWGVGHQLVDANEPSVIVSASHCDIKHCRVHIVVKVSTYANSVSAKSEKNVRSVV